MDEKEVKPDGLKVGSLFGIPVYMDLTIIIPIIAYPLIQWPDMQNMLITFVRMLVLFGIVLLHELGHGLIAKGFNYPVRSIQLMMFGGVCHIQAKNDRPGANLAVSVAGPFVNLVLATCALAYYLLVGVNLPANPSAQDYANNPVIYFGVTNVTILLFNLLPIFPMDGGRILQSILYFVFGRRPAVIITCWVSIVLLVAGTILAITTENYYYLLLVPLLFMANMGESNANLKELAMQENLGMQ